MFESRCKEQISIAYTHAVVTAARCKLEHIVIDDESIDATIKQEADHPLYDGAQLDIQLKCTAQQVLSDTHVSFALKKKNYDDLRSTRRYGPPAILIVMLVPQRIEEWVRQGESMLELAHCAYWTTIYGYPPTDTKETTVKLPRKNIFDVEQLLGIMKRIGEGGMP